MLSLYSRRTSARSEIIERFCLFSIVASIFLISSLGIGNAAAAQLFHCSSFCKIKSKVAFSFVSMNLQQRSETVQEEDSFIAN